MLSPARPRNTEAPSCITKSEEGEEEEEEGRSETEEMVEARREQLHQLRFDSLASAAPPKKEGIFGCAVRLPLFPIPPEFHVLIKLKFSQDKGKC